MKIGLDATRIYIPDGGGTYTREVIRHLLKRYHREHEFLLLIPKVEEAFDMENVKQYIYTEVDGIIKRLKYSFSTSRILKDERVDVFHNLTNYGVHWASCPQVTSVLDLLTLKFPELRSSKVHFWLYKYYIPFMLKNADCLVAISKNTRMDLLSLYGHYENVRDVYLGYNKDIFNTKTSGDADILNMYHLSPGYILFVGYVTPKKNLQVIARSLKLLKDEYRFTPRFVICGKRGHGAEKILSIFADLSIQDQVLELGFVPTGHLGALYRQAKLFVFPSIYEGFGLPVVEAMACQTPVIVSNVSSLVELVDNSALTCSPYSVECWAEKMRVLLQDPEHHGAAREWCLRRAEAFSWDACAEALMDIYVSLVPAGRSNGFGAGRNLRMQN